VDGARNGRRQVHRADCKALLEVSLFHEKTEIYAGKADGRPEQLCDWNRNVNVALGGHGQPAPPQHKRHGVCARAPSHTPTIHKATTQGSPFRKTRLGTCAEVPLRRGKRNQRMDAGPSRGGRGLVCVCGGGGRAIELLLTCAAPGHLSARAGASETRTQQWPASAHGGEGVGGASCGGEGRQADKARASLTSSAADLEHCRC
jgi:hypothetical protein